MYHTVPPWSHLYVIKLCHGEWCFTHPLIIKVDLLKPSSKTPQQASYDPITSYRQFEIPNFESRYSFLKANDEVTNKARISHTNSLLNTICLVCRCSDQNEQPQYRIFITCWCLEISPFRDRSVLFEDGWFYSERRCCHGGRDRLRKRMDQRERAVNK